jgi:hemolysin activation/secretion protein
MNITTRMNCCFLLCIVLFVGTEKAVSATIAEPTKTEPQLKLEEKAKKEQSVKEKIEAVNANQESVGKAKPEEEIAKLNLPEDTSLRLTVKEVIISGNTLISTRELLKDVPVIYNVSNKPLHQAESMYLFDLRVLQDVIKQPGKPREVSTRSIQGFTQYLLSVYQKQHYAGIYVYVLPNAIENGKLKEDILPIEIIEIPVSNIRTSYYDIEHNQKEKGYLRNSVFEEWSPAKVGKVIDKKKLEDCINLLNLDPDRYISTVVSEGAKSKSLAIGYDIYEINPWHYFAQIDNAGTKDRQWTPRVGFINTNLTGRDDKLTTILQGPVDKNPKDNYSIYGSYDVPLWTPRLRLNLFGGRSEFDVSGGGGIDFLGNGYVYGGKLRFNALQAGGWFFDLTTSLSREESKVTPSLFPEFFGSEVYMDLWGVGFDIHRRNDMSDTSFVFDRVQNIGGSGQDKFWDSATSTGARTNAERDFTILTFSANHSQFLNPNKIQRLLGSFKYILPNDRLVPAKMTTFGGMYTVRGYEEDRIVADGGILASLQYEYDLVKQSEAEEAKSAESRGKKPWLKKLAPLAFFDYGRAEIKNPVAGEQGAQELYSLGLGVITELGEHFNAGIYYGFPLRSTVDTKKGDGRLNIGLMMRW